MKNIMSPPNVPFTIISVGFALAILLSLTGVVEAQHEHRHPMIKEKVPTGSRYDERVALNLNEQASDGMKLTMREHLEATVTLSPHWEGTISSRRPKWLVMNSAFPSTIKR